jgi:hypothetical protein
MSALVIKAHVKEGVEMARKEKLPRVIIDVIRQHHGTTLIKYFYYQAKESAEEKQEDTHQPFSEKASARAKKKAKEAIGLAAPITRHSTVLSQNAHALSELITAYSKKILVKVLSDKQTKISVRGVGQVGVVTEKIIQLNPGSYTFEGKRDGYKSKLLRISVSPGDNQVEVKLICDERV